ncbi:MAG: PDZ domain-containing protein [Gammaproteobacteria bacterium]|nr:PDZ domain-containing protein [Gammaproteobacteria bacterium]
MKKIVLFGLVLSIVLVSGQFAIAEVKTATPDTTKEVKENYPSWLGVWIEKLPVTLSKHLSSMLKADQGLIIRKVSPDSPADKAGLLRYDIIVKMSDKEIFSEQQLVEIIRNTPPTTKVKLDIIRQGKLLSQEVTLDVIPRKVLSSNSAYTPKPGHHQGKGMRPFSAQRMNDPSFNRGFDQDFLKKQFNRMQQQLNQLQKQQQQLQQQQQQQQLQQQQQQQQQFKQQTSWSEFESIQVETTDKDKLRAVVNYEDSSGNKKEFIFEGNSNEVREQIKMNNEMEGDKKQSLLQALDMNNVPPLPIAPYGFMGPNSFNQPAPMPGWFRH